MNLKNSLFLASLSTSHLLHPPTPLLFCKRNTATLRNRLILDVFRRNYVFLTCYCSLDWCTSDLRVLQRARSTTTNASQDQAASSMSDEESSTERNMPAAAVEDDVAPQESPQRKANQRFAQKKYRKFNLPFKIHVRVRPSLFWGCARLSFLLVWAAARFFFFLSRDCSRSLRRVLFGDRVFQRGAWDRPWACHPLY